ncbi:MAG: hypothetical protein AAF998_23065 [Bacteroidota bacterium]
MFFNILKNSLLAAILTFAPIATSEIAQARFATGQIITPTSCNHSIQSIPSGSWRVSSYSVPGSAHFSVFLDAASITNANQLYFNFVLPAGMASTVKAQVSLAGSIWGSGATAQVNVVGNSVEIAVFGADCFPAVASGLAFEVDFTGITSGQENQVSPGDEIAIIVVTDL